jgi:ABC-2 type transport system ATP-binding protein
MTDSGAVVLRLSGVSKRYGRGPWVLRDVDLETSPGEVLAVTGGNGSGKSTLLRILAGISRPSEGTVSGRYEQVGYVPETFPRHDRMSAAAYLTHMGRIRGLTTRVARRRADELLDRLALSGGAHTAVRRLSKGNAQKVALAQAVLVRPQFLVLDEPWSGLDASVHDVLADLIRDVAADGGTVVFTDHRESVVRANASAIYELGDERLRRVAAVATTAEEAEVTGDAEEVAGVAEVVASPNGAGPAGHAGSAGHVDWSAFASGVTEVTRHGRYVTLRVAGERCDALLLEIIHKGWSVISVRRMTGAVAPARDEGVR